MAGSQGIFGPENRADYFWQQELEHEAALRLRGLPIKMATQEQIDAMFAAFRGEPDPPSAEGPEPADETELPHSDLDVIDLQNDMGLHRDPFSGEMR